MKLKQDRESPKESDARTLISWDTLKKNKVVNLDTYQALALETSVCDS